jgi:hypothetical protein
VEIVAVSTALTVAVIGGVATVLAGLLAVILTDVLGARRGRKQQRSDATVHQEQAEHDATEREVQERRDASQRRGEERREAADEYQRQFAEMAAMLEAVTRRDATRTMASRKYTMLQGFAKAQFRTAFGADSVVVWAEQRARSLLDGAIRSIPDEVGEATDRALQDVMDARMRALDAGMDNVLRPEMEAAIARPDETITVENATTGHAAREHLDWLAGEQRRDVNHDT